MAHIPVLLKEVIDGLSLSSSKTVFDGTLGAGGHAQEIIEAIMPEGMYVGCDQDEAMLEKTSNMLVDRFPTYVDRMRFVHDNYAHMCEILSRYNMKADAVIIDIGFSSWHVDASNRGFSFRNEEPLDMRYDTSGEVTASMVVNGMHESDLADLIFRYGEERFSRQIAKKIVERRRKEKIQTTSQLVETIREAVPMRYQKAKIHPATRTFQALRIYVNDELGSLRTFLETVPSCMNAGGRIGVISFHSLEDRMVKNVFREYVQNQVAKEITKKPIIPSRAEQIRNPRSRSAKLRIIETI